MPSFHDAYGIWSPEVTAMEIVNTRHKHSLMVIPLAGGGCASDDHPMSCWTEMLSSPPKNHDGFGTEI